MGGWGRGVVSGECEATPCQQEQREGGGVKGRRVVKGGGLGGGGFRVRSLGYQHPDADAKTAQTAETIRRRWERWKRVTLLAATVAGGRPRPTEGGYETAGRAAGGTLASVKKCYEMEIPAGRSRRPARRRQLGAKEPPGVDLQPLNTQPNAVGNGEVRRRVTPHPANTPPPPPCPPPPPNPRPPDIFLWCQQEIKHRLRQSTPGLNP